VWYSNVLIELFQVGFSLSQRNGKPVRKDTTLIKICGILDLCKRVSFTNQNVFSFRCTNRFSLFLFIFRSPSCPCGSPCRGGVTKKDAWQLNYITFQPYYCRAAITILQTNSNSKYSNVFTNFAYKNINISGNSLWTKYVATKRPKVTNHIVIFFTKCVGLITGNRLHLSSN
jgi:hypothetical protein